MRSFFAAVFFLFLFTSINAQSSFKMFPSGLTVEPFTANTLEPKLGFLFHVSENAIRLDISNSMDVFRITNADDYSKNSSEISMGVDMFTYTLLRGETNFHFPVDAVDYLFGLNACYKKVTNDAEYGARFRFSHISAHLVDGHFDGTNFEWKDNHPPRVYSREFFELMPYYKVNSLRVYGGLTYIFHIDPA